MKIRERFLASIIALRGNLFFSTAHLSKLQEVTHHHLQQQFIDTDLIVDMGTDLRKWMMATYTYYNSVGTIAFS